MLTKEQLAERKNGIYASEIAAVVGLSPWKTPGEVWVEKTGLDLDGEPLEIDDPEDTPNENMERGIYLERAILDWTAARTGEPIVKNATDAGVSIYTFTHPRSGWARATPDGMVYRSDVLQSVVEVKSPSWRTAHEWTPPDEDPVGIPTQYLCQVQWQMACSGAPRAGAPVRSHRPSLRESDRRSIFSALRNHPSFKAFCLPNRPPPARGRSPSVISYPVRGRRPEAMSRNGSHA